MIEYRLYDARAAALGPYYLTPDWSDDSGADEGPIAMLDLGLEQHRRWVRTGSVRARELFLSNAKRAAASQVVVAGVPGSYPFPNACDAYGCNPGYRSATAQGKAVSLLLRAYEETNDDAYLERAKDAAIPLGIDSRDGGVAWKDGQDLFFEHKVGAVPSHVLSGWIYALWGLHELARVTNLAQVEQLYVRGLKTLEKYLPCYDTGSWSYESLLAAPSGMRRFSSPRQHLIHVAQLDVLLSMDKNELFSVVSERWRGYMDSIDSRIRLILNEAAALPSLMRDALTIRGGARSIV